MYAGLDAMFRGAVYAAIVAPLSLFLFWRLAAPLGVGRRWPRPLLAGFASYGAVAAVGGILAYGFERQSLIDDTMAGALIIGAVILLPAFLLLLLIPPRKA